MTPFSNRRKLLGFTTALSLALPGLAFAQAADSAPPARVGQITAVAGNVSFNGSGTGGWAQAADNYPVSTGDSLYTQDGARAGIVLDASEISLSSDTELQVNTLDESSFAATLSQGEAAFDIHGLQPGQSYSVSTPRGTVGISQDGQYDIQAGTENSPTVVNVFQGAASIADPGVSLTVGAGQSGILSGTGQISAQLGQAQQDGFTGSAFAQNQAPPPAYAAAGCGRMTGVSELGAYGSWNQTPQYGAVWYPSVDAGWAPYRDGHWAYIDPWGWTWVENEPWGFAPFHYGRWIQFGDRWGWAPASYGSYGQDYQPVYAPALVTFFGVGAIGVTAALLASHSVGWVPLAPGEPYYPPYRAPAGYFREINGVNVRDVGAFDPRGYDSHFGPGHFANHGAATFVAPEVMAHGAHVGGHFHAPGADVLAAARPIGFNGGAGFRLPESSGPMAQLRPGAAPHPTGFAARAPEAGLHGGFGEARPQASGAGHGFTGAPGFHAPPAPPSTGQHLGALPAAGFHGGGSRPEPGFNPGQHGLEAAHGFAPQGGERENRPSGGAQENRPDQGFHPQGGGFHPQAEQIHPQAPESRAQPQFHPQTPEDHLPPQFHPQTPEDHLPPQFHPQARENPLPQQFHPQAQFHPQEARPAEMPRPQAQHDDFGNHGGADHHH